jgi:hypothetical protein
MKTIDELKLSKSWRDLEGKIGDHDLSEGEDSSNDDDQDEIDGRPKS